MLDIDIDHLRNYLVEVARRKDVVTYGQLAHDFGYTIGSTYDATQWGSLLGHLSTVENDAGRPLLSVIVVNKQDNLPSGGFWDMAQNVGRYGGLTPEDRVAFAINEMKNVYRYWTQEHE